MTIKRTIYLAAIYLLFFHPILEVFSQEISINNILGTWKVDELYSDSVLTNTEKNKLKFAFYSEGRFRISVPTEDLYSDLQYSIVSDSVFISESGIKIFKFKISYLSSQILVLKILMKNQINGYNLQEYRLLRDQ